MINSTIHFFLHNKLVSILLLTGFVMWGMVSAPFDWNINALPRDPVPVDAIPDIGENQQIVFTNWAGRSPQDIEDQITYPLTSALLGLPGVNTIRSSSVFGFSSIYIIFSSDIDYYWSRSRILEKLNSLAPGTLPPDVNPSLGPDATALGQVFWYTLEGRDQEGNVTGGWDLQELRSIQDFQVKYALAGVESVSEVASIGGFVKEYQIDVDPEALRTYGIGLNKVVEAVRKSNRDVGAKTIEINKVEYLVRGLGYIKSADDIGKAVISVSNNIPLRVEDVAKVTLGPATRRGILDKEGAEVVGGVVVARYGSNPLAVIDAVKERIEEISPGLPKRILNDGRESTVTIVPFYDRTVIIKETLGTLEEALTLEIIITILVILIMLMELRSSILVAGLLPVAVLMCFVAMRQFGVDANIVALSGIAIAIGTMVDLGIILTENILRHLNKPGVKDRTTRIYEAAIEVAPAILTAVLTTIVSFLPVFMMEAAEGKLFRPLAFTKTFALISALIVTIIFIPPLADILYAKRTKLKSFGWLFNVALIIGGIVLSFISTPLGGIILIVFGIARIIVSLLAHRFPKVEHLPLIITVGITAVVFTRLWYPLGANENFLSNLIFVVVLVAVVMGLLLLLRTYYTRLLLFFIRHKKVFLAAPLTLVVLGVVIWKGYGSVFGGIANLTEKVGINIQSTIVWSKLYHSFPGLGEEFMPALDEGSFLLMPTSMPHAGIEENQRVLRQLDMAVASIPEVEEVVGKLGRVESALDPAPISMYENVINYKPEYIVNESGKRIRFKTDSNGEFIYDSKGQLIPDRKGKYFRNWRDHINSPDDIWKEISDVTQLPGVTGAPRLQPIETRLVMLQTGMRAPMGIKIKGADLESIEQFGRALEPILKTVPTVAPKAVFADRIVGKPYLLIDIDRDAIARYGLSIEDVQQQIEVAIGGVVLTTTVEGRKRYPVRVRYPRELRGDPDAIASIVIPTKDGAQVPLGDLAIIKFERGPQVIKSEDTFLIGYVLFDKKEGVAEVTAVKDASKTIEQAIESGSLVVPAGISYTFAGNYENSVRASKRLSIVVPIVLFIIFLILYFQFRSVSTSLIVFSSIAVAFSGGFLMLWLYNQEAFLNFSVLGNNMREIFQVHPINLSVAVWVGFIALFGIATDDGVLMSTYLDQKFRKISPKSIAEIHLAVVEAASKRVRPALMTTGTTLLALLPILTATGRGADVMIPMAIPAFGGMTVALITLFVVPVLYTIKIEWAFRNAKKESDG
ncbi:MAG: Cu(I)/Ag(I) efflux system membrane protein CusA/SilA [Limisphaerales bacterium]|jgi:Cu(I)/Ag(I) efflux system membrane protein CusA/SilA